MRTGITSDGEDGAAPTAAGPSQVIPFRRTTAATSGPAAGDDPSSSPAIPLGELVNAVVLRLSNRRIRLKVLRAPGLGGGKDGGPR
ncbi:hypothetical protein CN221_36330 [Sinorhizobium meliloti]|nr:hypothetical protein C7U62_13115 [Mesorhizobium loti]RVG59720.1 hypothetical protein CN222_27560 [Sinorhizobium meliloti]RVG82336.1 hypothetical protein CN221_36330 [Sinorhizobium meliloti]RVH52580.1 hypothetical protein CN213_25195 [Sinorhizobium meliloti]RVH53923.1 hypothetical protein CN209_36255 [Sinorhizobium meliloti]